jgi:hypothetical protein
VQDSPPTSTILHVPDPYQSVVAAAHDIFTRWMKLNAGDGLRMTLNAQDTGGTDTDVPHLNGFILRAGQKNILKWMDRQGKHKVLMS